jgi:hypothetical protein
VDKTFTCDQCGCYTEDKVFSVIYWDGFKEFCSLDCLIKWATGEKGDCIGAVEHNEV